jgi:hypothetical protein
MENDLEIKVLTEICREVENYFNKLQSRANALKTEVMGALDKFCETKDPQFKVNGRYLDIAEFLITLKNVLEFKTPIITTQEDAANMPRQIATFSGKIGTLIIFLIKIPAAKFYLEDIPDIYKKVWIEKRFAREMIRELYPDT